MMKKILVTGGCGYIGSHTVVDLMENGFEVISVDNNSRSSARILEGVEKITGKKVKNYKVDLCNYRYMGHLPGKRRHCGYYPFRRLQGRGRIGGAAPDVF